MKPDSDAELPDFSVSYKPQKLSLTNFSTVRDWLSNKIGDSYTDPVFVAEVIKPLHIEPLMNKEVVNLSGGELQRAALCLCLGKVSDLNFKMYKQYLKFLSS